MRIKFMSSRAELPAAIRSVLEEYKAYDKVVSALKVDNEYASTAISMLAIEYKTHLHYCAPNEHFQNGSAEQAVQEVDRTGRATLFSADPTFPRSEWPEAYSFVEMVLNHTTESCIEGVSAEEWLTGEKPDAKRFAYIPFGVAVQGLVNKQELDKLDSRTFAGWNLGLAPHHQQCIRIYDPATKETKICRSYWVTSQYAEDGLVVDLESSIPDKALDLPTLQQHSRAARKRAEAARKKAIRQGDYDRTKHISRHFRFCADQVRANTIVVERIDTDKQRADQQTKILDPNLHKQHTAVNLNLKKQVQFIEDI